MIQLPPGNTAKAGKAKEARNDLKADSHVLRLTYGEEPDGDKT